MEKTKTRRTITGKVIKLSSINTAKVEVEVKYTHPRFEKVLKKHTKYLVHYTNDFKDLKVGDKVNFAETAPISKLKKFIITEIVK